MFAMGRLPSWRRSATTGHCNQRGIAYSAADYKKRHSNMIRALMVDVDGVLVSGRPEDGRPWASGIQDDLGFSVDQLQREFFAPHWNDIVTGRSTLNQHLKPALAKIAPHLSYEDFVAYWFGNDARLNVELLEQLDQQRSSGRRVYLATNQEHSRAAHLMEVLGLASHCDGIYYSAALGCKKPDKNFFERVSVGFHAELSRLGA
jgi:putative hydrolase of the HAD superfamily